MAPVIENPGDGEWYLSVTCARCHCKILLFHDLNHGNGNIRGIFKVTCPTCNRRQELPAEHYQHQQPSPELCA